MAFLKVVKGSCPGQILSIADERMMIGRHPHCQIVLDNAAVSRYHAQLLESHGHYYLEDLRSRNGTLLNGIAIEGRTELHDNDHVKVCELEFTFHFQMPASGESTSDGNAAAAGSRGSSESPTDEIPGYPGTVGVSVGDEPPDIDGDPDTSSIITTLNAVSSANFRLGVKPEVKLGAVLEISKALGNVLELGDVLDTILNGLFKLFPHAVEGFVLLKDAQQKTLIIRATKTRDGQNEKKVRISMTIVKQAMKTGEAILSADALKDSRFNMSDSLSQLKIRSLMCVPMMNSADEPMGVLQIDAEDAGYRFTQDDLDLILSVTSLASLAVENASLHEELMKQRDDQRDLQFATQVQLGFLPTERPKLPGYEFADYYEAALRVGGDYFDYVPLSDTRVAIALGDVAGKGVPAALLMARLYSSARYLLLTKPTASEAMAGLNVEIASSGLGHRFITFVIAILDIEKQEVTFANAGHLPPVLRHADGEIETIALTESGMPLGIAPEQQFTEVTMKLAAGTTCVLYTDGISEAMNSKNEIYGRIRLSEFIRGGPTAVEPLVKGIVADVETFCDGRSQTDDMCLVGLRRVE